MVSGLFLLEHRKKVFFLNFKTFNFHPRVAAGVVAAGYVEPTPIQARAIPEVLNSHDIMGVAQTGTGKTAAFVLPILHRLMTKRSGGVGALIMAPTRELAEQIHQAIEILGRETHVKSVTVYGGVGIHPQIEKLKHAHIVVACPGRLLDHMNRGTVDFSRLEVLVVDEADQMLDMGFLPDIRRILARLPKKRQTLLFSATMPSEIRRLAGDILKNPSTIQVGAVAPADTVSHALYPVPHHLKTALLVKLLSETNVKSVLVFTRTKYRAKSLGKKLVSAGYPCASLQGNLSQGRRQAALEGFRHGTFKILVATDIAARGIDVTRVSHVINYDIPSTPEAYIHRIGRTGRATRSGEAFTFMTGEDKDMVRAINRILGASMEQRTLQDFDYGVAVPTATAGKASRPVRGRHPKRKGPAKGMRGRAQRGALSWFSDQGKSSEAGRNMQTA
jgi:ATP-dependent RNA helicase RhlE